MVKVVTTISVDSEIKEEAIRRLKLKDITLSSFINKALKKLIDDERRLEK